MAQWLTNPTRNHEVAGSQEIDGKENAAELPFIPKLTDFGLAKLTEHASDTTIAGAVLGTPQYMAPEQAAGLVERVGPATDVYSLGAVLYEMLSGRPPIRGTTTIDTLRRVLIDDPTPPKHLGPQVPDDLDAIVMKALDKSPTRRYPTARDLAADLQRFLDHRPTLARPLSAIERAARWVRRNPSASLLTALAISVIALTVGLLAYARRIDVLTDETNRRRAEENYAYDMQRAYQLVLDRDVSRATVELRRYLPREGATDLRGLEWHYLWALTTHESFASAATAKAGTDGDVYQIAISPQGDQLAAACKDGSLYLYDSRSLSQQAKIRTNHGEVNGVAFSPDGRQVATVGDDGFVRIWNARKKVMVRQFKAHEAKAYNVVYFDEGRKLATCGEEPIIRLWEAETGQSAGVLEGHSAPVEAIALSPSGELLASAGEDRQAIVWDLAAREVRTRLEGHGDKLSSLCFSPDGEWLATGGQDCAVCLWRHARGRRRACGFHLDAVQSVSFTRDGRLLAGDRGGTIRTYQLGPQFPEVAAENSLDNPEDNWLAHQGKVWSLALLPEEGRFVSSGHDGSLRAWTRGQTLVQPWKPDSDQRYVADFSRDGSRLFVVGQRNGIEIFDRAAPKSQSIFLNEPKIAWESLAVLKGREQVAAASQQGEIYIWNWRTHNLLHTWKIGNEQPIQRMAYSSEANLLAAVAYAREDVLLIDPNTGEEVAALAAPSCTDCAFSPDGRQIAIDTLNRLAIFDIRTQKLLRLLPGHSETINAIAYSPDGRLIATASSDRTVRLWTADGSPVAELSGHAAGVLTLAFTHGGKSLVTGAEDGRIKVFHVATRRELIDIETGFKRIRRLSIAPDNRQIAVIGDDWKLALVSIPPRGDED